MVNDYKISPDKEREILDFWEKKGIDKKLFNKNKGKKTFSFYDGPPTANNPMGVHHAWGRTYKDLYLRYKRMRRYDERVQPGFDCQGLWVEVGIEKELGLKSKKDIEKYGLDNFSEKCKNSVLKYSKLWVELSKRLGMLMNWNEPYFTMSDKNNELVWYFIKECYKKRWLTKGIRTQPWCPRCGTGLSSHEVAVGYTELEHESIYIKYPIIGTENEYLLVWTTTPWTLPSNVACAVNPEFEYVKVNHNGQILYVAQTLLKVLKGEYKLLKLLKGKDLENIKYLNHFENLPQQRNVEHKVVLNREVSSEEGTGIVHIAPGHGEVDFEIGREYKLPTLCPVTEDSTYDKNAGWLEGKKTKEANPLIISYLDEKGALYNKEKITHRYPCCWRCGEELIYITVEGWYIKSDEIKPLLKKEAKKVRWYPENLKERMLAWLDGLRDWNISRRRYWGNPLPIWTCACGEIEIIGTLKELKQKAIKGMEQLKELHRPWIDNVILKCKCGKEMHRIKEVGDCWLDAGVVPFSTIKYLDDRKYWSKWFPADFITEMHEQVRLWFYAMLFISCTLEGKAPYKSVLGHGMVLAEDGREMHKSWGNAIWAEEALDKIGGDVMRWMYANGNPSLPVRFGWGIGKEAKNVLNVLLNTGNFVKLYIDINNFKPGRIVKPSFEDEWALSKLNKTIKTVTEALDKLQPHIAKKEIEDFFLNDFSRWYIKIVRDKAKDDKQTLIVLYKILLETIRLIAPFTPFLSEAMYQNIFKKFEKLESIHLHTWPKTGRVNEEVIRTMAYAQESSEKILALRDENKVRIRWPVKTAYLKNYKAVKEANEIIKKMCNILELKKGTEDKLDLAITQEMKESALLREITRMIQAFRKECSYKVGVTEKLHYDGDEPVVQMIEKEKKELLKNTTTELLRGKTQKTFKLNVYDKEYEIKLGKV